LAFCTNDHTQGREFPQWDSECLGLLSPTISKG
jgi:hypothetical protein